jgi:hypothetical protein
LQAIPEEGEVEGGLKPPVKKKKKPKKEKKKGDNPMSDLMGEEGTKAELGESQECLLINRGKTVISIVSSIFGECSIEENVGKKR